MILALGGLAWIGSALVWFANYRRFGGLWKLLALSICECGAGLIGHAPWCPVVEDERAALYRRLLQQDQAVERELD